MIPSRWSSALEILRRRQQRVDEDTKRLREQCPHALLAAERAGDIDAAHADDDARCCESATATATATRSADERP